MALTSDELRFAVTDARTKLEKVCGQISEGDKQAQTVLQIYITLAVAALSCVSAPNFDPYRRPTVTPARG